MKRAVKIDEIDDYLRDGGSIEELMIECEPSQKKRQFSRVGMEIDQDKDRRYQNSSIRRWNR